MGKKEYLFPCEVMVEACYNKVFEVAVSVHDSTGAENLDLPTCLSLSFVFFLLVSLLCYVFPFILKV